MGRLLIIGAGSYGRVAAKIARDAGWEDIVFADDISSHARYKISDIENIPYDKAVVAIGNPAVRERIFNLVESHATLVHPNAVVYGTVGEGSIVEPGAVIYGAVGRGCIIMSNSVVGHNAVVGDFCQLKYCSAVAEYETVTSGTQIENSVITWGINAKSRGC